MNADHVSPEFPFVWWLLSSAVLAVGEYDSTGAVFLSRKSLTFGLAAIALRCLLPCTFLGSAVFWFFGLVVGRCTHPTRFIDSSSCWTLPT